MTDRELDKAIDVLRNVLTSTRCLSRRAFLQHLSSAAAGSALLGTFARALTNTAHAETPVTTIGWGGAWQDAMETAFFKPWTRNNGIPVQYITPYDFSKLMAMHKAGQQQVDVVEAGTREPAHDGILGALGDLVDGGEVAFRGDRKAGLDDVDAHLVEQLGDFELFLVRHGGAGTLLAVAQRGVEDDDAVFLGFWRRRVVSLRFDWLRFGRGFG